MMFTQRLKNRLKELAPDKLLMAQLVLRRSAIWKRSGLIFVHVPKNGGTSINNALYGRFMGHFRVRDIESFRPDLLEKLPSAAVSRNPWARAFSAWNFARKGGLMEDGAQISRPERYQIPEFSSFERFVLEWLPGRDLEIEDYVFRPQSHFLLNRQNEIAVDHLGRIEDPDSYLGFFEETLGRQLEVKVMNRTVDPLAYREAYTPEMRDILAHCYADDLKRLDYDF